MNDSQRSLSRIKPSFLSRRRWPSYIPPALKEDKILALDVFGSVTQFLSKRGHLDNNNASELDMLDTATDLNVYPAQGIMRGIFGGSSRAVKILNSSYYSMLHTFLKNQSSCMTDCVILSALACCSQSRDVIRLFLLVAPF